MSTLTVAANLATAPNVPSLVNPTNKTARRSKKRGRTVTKSKDGQISTSSHPSTERFHMSDTSTAGLVAPVAPIAIQSEKKSKKKAAFKKSVFNDDTGLMPVSTAEGALVECLQRLHHADKSIKARAEWDAWDLLHMATSEVQANTAPPAGEYAENPLLFAAAEVVAVWIRAYQDKALAEAKERAASNG